MSALPSIYFRTDGNSEIATGHIMRCLAIARACVRQGADVAFIVSDEESISLLQERFDRPEEFGIHCLHSDCRKMVDEIPALLAFLQQDYVVCTALPSDSTSSSITSAQAADARPWLFIDSYFVTPAYFAQLRSHCRVAYLDDLRSFSCDVDLVVYYDTDEDCTYYTAAKRKLLGAAYTPLREQFEQPAYEVRPTVQNILLSTGGTDPYHVAEGILGCIFSSSGTVSRQLTTCDYHILTSTANHHYDRLLALAKDNPKIHIHTGINDMASLMATCDLAVSAGGTTLCELCAVGVPTVSYLMAENQRTAVETFSAKGLIPYAGDIRSVQNTSRSDKTLANNSSAAASETSPDINISVLENILDFMTLMSQNIEARKKSSHAMRAFLDGQGAKRIATALLSPDAGLL